MNTRTADSGLRIDVHAHYLPDVYVRALESAGLDLLDGFPRPEWSAEAHLAAMERYGIGASILSISTPCVHFLKGRPAQRLARAVNEAAGELIESNPGRFGAFASLPLPDAVACVEEIVYAFDSLKLDGVIVETNANGVYLGAAELEPVYAELDRRGAAMLIHPTSPACFQHVGMGRPAPMIEFAFDTTRAVVDLIFSGVLRRYPNIRVVVPHGGGTLALLAPRLAMFAEMPFISPKPQDAAALLAELRRLHYDLAASANPVVFGALRQLVPASQILFATDWPFTPEKAVARNVEGFAALEIDDAEREAIAFRNALRLFPKLAARIAASK